MSTASDFFSSGGGVQIGDYLRTTRTEGLVPADGRVIDHKGYTDLAEMPNSISAPYVSRNDADNNQISILPTNHGYGYLSFMKSGTSVGWAKPNSTSRVLVNVPRQASDACTTLNQRVHFMVSASNGTTDLIIARSENQGASWTTQNTLAGIEVGVTFYSTDLSSTTRARHIAVKCSPDGKELTVLCKGSNGKMYRLDFSDYGAVLDSTTDLGTTPTSAPTGYTATLSEDRRTLILAGPSNLYTPYISHDGEAFRAMGSIRSVGIALGQSIPAIGDGRVVVPTYVGFSQPVSDSITVDVSDDYGRSFYSVYAPAGKGRTYSVAAVSVDQEDKDLVYCLVNNKGSIQTESTFTEIGVLNIKEGTWTILSIFQGAQTDLDTTDWIDFKSFLRIDGRTSLVFHFNSGQQQMGVMEIYKGKVASFVNEHKMMVGDRVPAKFEDFTSIQGNLVTDYIGAYISADKQTIIGTGYAAINASQDGGATWSLPTHSAVQSAGKMAGSDDATKLIAGFTGDVQYSTNKGLTWNSSTGLFSTGTTINDQVKSCTSDSTGSNMYICFVEGQVQVSVDGGASFANNSRPMTGESDETLFSLCMSKTDSDIMFAGSNNLGLVKRTTDGGATWLDPTVPPEVDLGEISSVGRVFALSCSASGSTVVALIGRRAYISRDTGQNWEEVTPWSSLASKREVVVSDDGQNIIFSDSNGILYQSSDNGLTFKEVNAYWADYARQARAMALTSDATQLTVMVDEGGIFQANEV